MPLYEYQCEACAHRFEQIRRFSDPPLTTCPECEGTVRKLLSPPAIQFKGTGWYVTDYARQGKKDPADAGDSKAAKASDGASNSEKSEKKSEKADAGKSGGSSGSSDAGSGSGSAKPATAGASS
jgi:putative FmdB family regulatory protein